MAVPVKPHSREPWWVGVVRSSMYLAAIVILAFLLKFSFDFIQAKSTPKTVIVFVGLLAGVGGVWLMFTFVEGLIGMIPNRKIRNTLQPFIFIGPAILLLCVYLIYPIINTIVLSFLDARSESFIGLANYQYIFSDPGILVAFRNNAYWLVTVTFFCVALGLVFAVLVDRVKYESLAKSFIFLPVAISSAGAAVIWRFMYAYKPACAEQYGVINALVQALGFKPLAFMTIAPLNTFMLIAIMVWLQTGFCMVVLSAAVKNVPGELMEASRIDGANEFQIFFHITIPYIRGTIIAIATTTLIMVLKIFDIVYVMTRGNYDTEVIANRMYIEMFTFRNFGHGTALAVILFLAVMPAVYINIRNLRQQRS